MSESDRPLIQVVPEAREVRAQVGERLRELRLLRRLLRLATAVDDYRRERQGTCHGGHPHTHGAPAHPVEPAEANR